ncbi:carboxypeptidase S [Lactifluus subvellereus]|nr:carboxypeptidase S [Lactifluus subvellereus]
MAKKDEKPDLLSPAASVEENRPRKSRWKVLGLTALLAFAMMLCYTDHGLSLCPRRLRFGHHDVYLSSCPQSDALYPGLHVQLWESLGNEFDEDAFTKRAVDWLGGAVRIPTESYDDMDPVGADTRWEVFRPFHDYLLQSFPLTHNTLTLTKVNTYGLLYEWKGSDDGLKPLLLTAHQDVVPVDPETVDQWKYPPYSGYYDGEFIWGRGCIDDKGGLIGILSSVEILLEKNFQPVRTIVLAFGFDEEASGVQGAGSLSRTVLEKYGENSMALLVDEGGQFQTGSRNRRLYYCYTRHRRERVFGIRVTVSTAGGHSSVPPPHTSIGILSRLLVEYEDKPIEAHLERDTPIYSTVQCVGEHAKNFPESLRALIKASAQSDGALHKLEAELIKNDAYKALIGTTQAIDLVQGGVKANALPEETWAVINHRIAMQSSVAEVQQRDTDVLKDLAKEFNLTFTAFGSAISPQDRPSAGSLTLTVAWEALEPAPVTPTDRDSAPWQLLSGTIKATYNAQRGLEGADNIVVSPGIMNGNTGRLKFTITDTGSYWKLTSHIFRYTHFDTGNGIANGIHTVNEHVRARSFVEIIRFFTTLILNVDETTTF